MSVKADKLAEYKKNAYFRMSMFGKVCPTRFDHCRDLFRGELSINQAIYNIYLGTKK